ncbi:phosphatidylserine decarboxylase [Desulfosporosinus sp. Sb-LF]|uniref:phosphatidylserine decarboxylase n=1 Tax=Desulfosporosinus sp. Sb-LF TaxID=2560027 RepID=UPI00107F0045|nr:phosphatidylserine decarboxylase [Desulfosporosinus sp. Sb-LF]TGE32161.1 phosphatidylserine decarboxylase [Desulfosporosinus sp. Sb-LF]
MIKVYNRKTGNCEIEKVAGESYINWIYSSSMGMKFLELFVKKKLASNLCGYYCNRVISRTRIKKFVDEFKIDMSRFEIPKGDFRTFNEFFHRKLKADYRPDVKDKSILISPCDGKILAYEDIDIKKLVQIKGITYSLGELIGADSVSSKYAKGSCLIVRLSPSDYHRFHFVDDGVCSQTTKIKGFYYSVNPTSINKINKIFCSNKREWSILRSDNFGEVLYVEVGATFVGSIIQTYMENRNIRKGDEKGYFKFGGSTVILFFKDGVVKVDKDIMEQTAKGIECSVEMGERIGLATFKKK